MLVLGLRMHESIMITCPDGTEITVQLLDKRYNHDARLGIVAPREYEVVRLSEEGEMLTGPKKEKP